MATEWFYTTNKQQMGPVSWNELRELADGGILKPHDLVWSEGMEEWVKAISQSGLFTDEDHGGKPTRTKKASAYIDATPPPGRRSKRTEEIDDEVEEDEKESKRKARQRQQDRSRMAVGVKVGLILVGIVFVLLLLAGCGGLLFYLSFAGGGPQLQPGGPPPVAKKGQPPQPGAAILNNTTWIGNETLQGFGRLEFRFRAGGQVTMFDAAGQSQGKYTVQGNTATMRFEGGQVTYTGAINGRTMTGNARNNADENWTFTVTR